MFLSKCGSVAQTSESASQESTARAPHQVVEPFVEKRRRPGFDCRYKCDQLCNCRLRLWLERPALQRNATIDEIVQRLAAGPFGCARAVNHSAQHRI